jgi:hypothetical protein
MTASVRWARSSPADRSLRALPCASAVGRSGGAAAEHRSPTAVLPRRVAGGHRPRHLGRPRRIGCFAYTHVYALLGIFTRNLESLEFRRDRRAGVLAHLRKAARSTMRWPADWRTDLAASGTNPDELCGCRTTTGRRPTLSNLALCARRYGRPTPAYLVTTLARLDRSCPSRLGRPGVPAGTTASASRTWLNRPRCQSVPRGAPQVLALEGSLLQAHRRNGTWWHTAAH